MAQRSCSESSEEASALKDFKPKAEPAENLKYLQAAQHQHDDAAFRTK
eukprot:COSAG02_NODE_4607_length_5172_cov_2.482555_7_plen_48_part_00